MGQELLFKHRNRTDTPSCPITCLGQQEVRFLNGQLAETGSRVEETTRAIVTTAGCSEPKTYKGLSVPVQRGSL